MMRINHDKCYGITRTRHESRLYSMLLYWRGISGRSILLAATCPMARVVGV